MVATVEKRTFQEVYQAFTEADEKYGAFVQALPEVPAKDQIEQAEKMNNEVKELEAEVLQHRQGDELRQQFEERKARRNTPIDNVGFGTGTGPDGKSKTGSKEGQTWGDMFMQTPQVKSWFDQVAPQGHVADRQSIQSPRVPMPGLSAKALITGLADASAGAFMRPTYLDLVQVPFRPLTLKDLISVVRVSSDAVTYARLLTQTNAATSVLEATTTAGAVGAKPESDMTFETVTETIKTIAHWFAVTNRALADAPQIRDLINQFGFYGLEEELEDQIAAGSGVGENLTGISVVSGISTQAYATSLLVTTRKAITKARTVHARINGWLFSLNDWEAIELLTDNTNKFYYGGPQILGSPRLWGYPVVDSEALADGYAYVGDFKTVVLFDREQASMQMTNSHSDFFIRNLVAMLFEMRVGLGYLRPAAIVKTDLTA